MKNKNYTSLIILFLLLFSQSTVSGEKGVNVSIINLIATPRTYHSNTVFVTGYLHIEFENNSLCLSKSSASSKDCIWIEIDNGPFESDKDIDRYKSKEKVWQKFNGQVVSVRGTFDSDNLGHMGQWSGAIRDTTDIFGEKSNYFFSKK